MGWFRMDARGLRFKGITRVPFAYWLDTADGKATVSRVSQSIGFRLFGRRRAAEGVLWRELRAMADDGDVQAIVREQALAYHKLLASFAFVDVLPKAIVDLRRLVVVPRLLLNARALQAMREQLDTLVQVNELRGGQALYDFFVAALVDEMDRAFLFARPSPRHPVAAYEQWAVVAVDLHFTWETPDWSGPSWPGHHYVHEQPREGLTRRQRRRLKTVLDEVNGMLTRWPRPRRHETLQHAQQMIFSS